MDENTLSPALGQAEHLNCSDEQRGRRTNGPSEDRGHVEFRDCFRELADRQQYGVIFPAGAVKSNTASHPSQLIPSKSFTGGVDTISCTIRGTVTPGHDKRVAAIKLAMTNARSGGLGKLSGMAFVGYAKKTGIMWGDRYLGCGVESDGITVFLTENENPIAGQIVAKLEIGSARLMRDGHFIAVSDAMHLLTQLGVVVESCKVSRFDLCVDVPGPEGQKMLDDMANGRIVTPAREVDVKTFDGRVTGVSVGRRGKRIYFRAYDKSLEMRQNPNEAKERIFREMRLGIFDDETPTPGGVIRFEFELTRDFFADRNYSDIWEVLDALPNMWAYLVDWLRVTDRDPDRKNNNQDRAKPSAEWEKVIDYGYQWIQFPPVLMWESKRERKRSLKSIEQGVIGYISGLAARAGCETWDVFMRQFQCFVRRNERAIMAKARDKLERDSKVSLDVWGEPPKRFLRQLERALRVLSPQPVQVPA